MYIYFLNVLLSACISTWWCVYRFKKLFNVRKALFEATVFNVLLYIIASVWWIISQKDGMIVIPGILYYIFALIIIFTINKLTISLLKGQ